VPGEEIVRFVLMVQIGMWDAPLLALFQKWEYDSLQRKFFEVEVLSITLKQFFRHDDSASFSLKIALCPIQSVTTEVVICISVCGCRLCSHARTPAQATLFDLSLHHIWQKRFYDFDVWSLKKQMGKLNYMHDNPVKRGLVESPALWRWSSYRTYFLGETGKVRINQWDVLKLKARAPAA
jgi:hypothetical protein